MINNMHKKLKKIVETLENFNKVPRYIVTYGTRIALLILAIGTTTVILSKSFSMFYLQFDIISAPLIKTSFIILAEAIIGAIFLDCLQKGYSHK